MSGVYVGVGYGGCGGQVCVDVVLGIFVVLVVCCVELVVCVCVEQQCYLVGMGDVQCCFVCGDGVVGVGDLQGGCVVELVCYFFCEFEVSGCGICCCYCFLC